MVINTTTTHETQQDACTPKNLELCLDGEAVQVDLDDLVERSLRDRRGFGRGTVYTVGPGDATETTA